MVILAHKTESKVSPLHGFEKQQVGSLCFKRVVFLLYKAI